MNDVMEPIFFLWHRGNGIWALAHLTLDVLFAKRAGGEAAVEEAVG